MDELKKAVEQSTSVAESAILLIKGISERIAAAGTDETSLKELTDSLNSESNNLAEAVKANTPAA